MMAFNFKKIVVKLWDFVKVAKCMLTYVFYSGFW
jgi:hypothetical protein